MVQKLPLPSMDLFQTGFYLYYSFNLAATTCSTQPQSSTYWLLTDEKPKVEM